jgi:hypothetical protein
MLERVGFVGRPMEAGHLKSRPRLIKFHVSGYLVRIPVTFDVLSLVVSNLIPIFGICFLGWDLYAILFLFWSENLIAGVFNVLAMAACTRMRYPFTHIRWGVILFFIFHFGMFTVFHGCCLYTLSHRALAERMGLEDPTVIELATEALYAIWTPFVALVVSYTVSFVLNFLWRGEFRRVSIMVLMLRPYGRLVLLQVALLVGGAIAAPFGQHGVIVALLMLLKVVFDLFGHIREREMLGTLPKSEGKKFVLSEQFRFFPDYEYVDVDETFVIRRPYAGGPTELLQPDETWIPVPEEWYFDKKEFDPLGNRLGALSRMRSRHPQP